MIQKDREKASFKNEIDVSTDSADAQSGKILDDALLLNISPVYIIHGKGKEHFEKDSKQTGEIKYIKVLSLWRNL